MFLAHKRWKNIYTSLKKSLQKNILTIIIMVLQALWANQLLNHYCYAGLMLWIDKTLTYLIYLEHFDPIIALGSVEAVLHIADQFATQVDKDVSRQQSNSDIVIDGVITERLAGTIEIKKKRKLLKRLQSLISPG
jgi:hypothetical protein